MLRAVHGLCQHPNHRTQYCHQLQTQHAHGHRMVNMWLQTSQLPSPDSNIQLRHTDICQCHYGQMQAVRENGCATYQSEDSKHVSFPPPLPHFYPVFDELTTYTDWSRHRRNRSNRQRQAYILRRRMGPVSGPYTRTIHPRRHRSTQIHGAETTLLAGFSGLRLVPGRKRAATK